MDAQEILPSRSELRPDMSRLGGPETAEFELVEHCRNFGTDDSSEENGIKSGQVNKADLDGEGACDLTLMATSGGKFPDEKEEAVRSTTGVASRILG